MTLPPLLVFPTRFVAGWDGDIENLGDVETHIVLGDLGPDFNPFCVDFETDAHCVAYGVEGEETIPRLNMPAAHTVDVKKLWMLVDIDNPGHSEWTERLERETFEALAKLPEFDHCGWYLTKHGLRLVWPLPEPVDVEESTDYTHMFLDHVELLTGLECDRACTDWTRLFRLPFVVRDGEPQELPSMFRNMEPLEWKPPRSPIRGNLKTAGKSYTKSKRPASVTAPTKRDYQGLAGTEWYHRLVDGAPLSGPGARNASTMSCLGSVVVRLDLTDPYAAYKLLYRSVQAQVSEGSKWDLDWLWGRCEYVCALHEGEKASTEAVKRALAGLTATEDEDLEFMAAQAMGVEPEAVRQHLVLVLPLVNYVFNETTMGYGQPVRTEMIYQQLATCCPTLAGHILGPNGGVPSTQVLLRRYATPALEVELVIGDTGTRYDAERNVVIEGVGAIRTDLQPEHNPEIERWLKLLGGKEHEKLLDWLATLAIFHKPTCALYLKGEPSLGKGMLAEGLSRLWRKPLTDYSELSKDFTQELAKCPLIWADEKIPLNRGNATALFRKYIGSSVFPMTRKFKGNATLLGCPRVLITANNEDALSVRERLTEQDLEAIGRRIGYIKCSDKAGKYLAELGGRDYTEQWVSGDGIARHVLWLMENREVVAGERYIVEGWDSDLTRNLVTMAGYAGNVAVAVATLIGEDMIKHTPRCLIGDGRILINARDLLSAWRSLMGQDARTPEEWKLTDALGVISLGKDRKRILGSHVSLWDVDPRHIYATADRQNLYPPEELQQVVERHLPKLVDTKRKKSQ